MRNMTKFAVTTINEPRKDESEFEWLGSVCRKELDCFLASLTD